MVKVATRHGRSMADPLLYQDYAQGLKAPATGLLQGLGNHVRRDLS